MKLRVTGLSSPPSIFWMRPFWTVTSRVHASGQSSGQAVRTVECPQVSVAACPERAERVERACPEPAERVEGAMADYNDQARKAALLEVGAFAAGPQVISSGAVAAAVGTALGTQGELIRAV